MRSVLYWLPIFVMSITVVHATENTENVFGGCWDSKDVKFCLRYGYVSQYFVDQVPDAERLRTLLRDGSIKWTLISDSEMRIGTKTCKIVKQGMKFSNGILPGVKFIDCLGGRTFWYWVNRW